MDDIDPSDLKKLADVADQFGKELTQFAAGKRDEIVAKFEDESIANHIALNAMVNMLAYGVAIIRAHQSKNDINDHIDPVMSRLHETVAELLGEDGGKVAFFRIHHE